MSYARETIAIGASPDAAQSADSKVATADDLAAAIGCVRAATAGGGAGAARTAKSLARAIELWRDRDHPRRRGAVLRIAANLGLAAESLNESLDALLEPFSGESLASFAARFELAGRAERLRAPGLTIGFIMAGNVAGAGLHEVAIALIAGAGLVIKTASAEPVFFDAFARTLAELDAETASRMAVLNWSRMDGELTDELIRKCDRVVAFGDDANLASMGLQPKMVRFGSRVSAAAIATSGLSTAQIGGAANLIARDIALFEQLGCLSPHHVFVVDPVADAAPDFASRIATALELLATTTMPPAKIPLFDAALVRSVRENSRWRRIGGEPIQLFEGPRLSWTVVFDRTASFSVSPGYRTVHVSGVRDISELRVRLVPAAGKLEAIAVGGDDAEVTDLSNMCTALGVSYLAAPGRIQSPPLQWRHGGGEFIDLVGAMR